MNSKLSEKVIVLGIDGMDPRLSRKYVDAGKMPNLKKIIERGACREDLVLLGAHPTITPPMWTTLATGAYPETHGITCFWAQNKDEISAMEYNLDSRKCKAEQIWNVTVEAGKKTLVWHWPGSSWPPTSDSPLLHVVDGTQPASVNMMMAACDAVYVIEASTEHTELHTKSKNWYAAGVGCVIENLEIDGDPTDAGALTFSREPSVNIMLSLADGEGAQEEIDDKEYVYTPLKNAEGWANAPEDAKEFEFTMLMGHVKRYALVIKNEEGIYDTVQLYVNKESTEPFCVLQGVNNSVFMNFDTYNVGAEMEIYRTFNLMEVAPDGTKVRMITGGAYNHEKHDMFYPESLHQQVIDAAGHVPPIAHGIGEDPEIVRAFHMPGWEYYCKWQGDAINGLIRENNYDVVFSHLHNLDCVAHCFWMHGKTRKHSLADESVFQGFMQEAYEMTDRYLGQFVHLLDEGWTIVVTSDHGLLVREEEQAALIGDPFGVNAYIMWKLGYTAMVTTETSIKKEIDWTKTKAVANRGNYIWLNIKGRDKHVLPDGTVLDGIVDPADKYKLEEQIMQDLYNYRDKTGFRVISLVLRNKDAAILGLSGPETGDLVYWVNEGGTRCHGDCLSTTLGYADTSVSPIFVAAGAGIKENVYVDRVIRQVDVAPTIAYLLGIRPPAQSEGAIVHQIINREVC